MSNKKYDRHVRLARVRLVAYDYLTSTQQRRSLSIPDLSPTPLATTDIYTTYAPYVLYLTRRRKPPLRRIILLYD